MSAAHPTPHLDPAAETPRVQVIQRSTSIMTHLGRRTDQNWSVETETATQCSVYVRGPGFATLHLSFERPGARGSLTVRGVHPAGSGAPDGTRGPVVTVAAGRTDRFIARQVHTLLLPEYLEELQAARPYLENPQHERAARRELAYDIAGICGGEVYYTHDRYHVDFRAGSEQGRFHVLSSSQTQLEMISANPDVVCEIAALLARGGRR
ncbi:hypothetical protein KIH74_28770 [Kineosporia sp. J2-2]|uniref:Uncharacterized protein n=1 Tax=Kineosporia corallincola TaxID=2835133 RepID=A0ABS5TPF4_9ACTN|nr:hypothetical protein [Kineosporia corallincola]MBT0772971.1 hypothetical protein [Kineosporia corallincola]